MSESLIFSGEFAESGEEIVYNCNNCGSQQFYLVYRANVKEVVCQCVGCEAYMEGIAIIPSGQQFH